VSCTTAPEVLSDGAGSVAHLFSGFDSVDIILDIRRWSTWLIWPGDAPLDSEGDVKVNMLEAKSQLSKLVKHALDGEDVVIASNGKPMVRLVPVARKGSLRGWVRLKTLAVGVDAAFTPEVETEVARILEGRS
jgi:prevent-host-death family protein